jgi:drug/metabolite transporter (DMT)-like permease
LNKLTLKALLLGILSAFFFTTTYILNRKMALGGGYWMWSAALRYLITLPVLLAIGSFNQKIPLLFKAMRADFMPWVVWGSIGFGAFYLTLTLAANSSPAWLIAGTFQLTIVAGLLISPFIYDDYRAKIPRQALIIAIFILFGVILSQIGEIKSGNMIQILSGFVLVTLSSIFFPLGNRKILLHLERKKIKLDAFQRVLGMTIGSMPLWILVSIFAYTQSGIPPINQVIQSGIVAQSAGVIATILFFKATALVKTNPASLGAVEATQSLEIVIALIAEMVLLNGMMPGLWGIAGILIICLGMSLYAVISVRSL